jgi:glycosyltransferase involved in cell wall biosynthesis
VKATLALSVVLCTYNRARLLGDALRALLTQTATAPPYEVLVVDNNSTDDTRSVIGRFAADSRIRYVREPQQGLSAARNRGIRASRAPIIAFTDDDVRVDPTWVQTVVDTFARHPHADWMGGKVEANWPALPPEWLHDTGSAPLAILDYGGEPFAVTPARPVCLIGANLAVRRRAFNRTGLFSTRVERRGDTIGSTEDHELQIRMLNAGLTGCYEPALVVRADVPHERLSKRYHRRWHEGHGRFYALMREPSFERSDTATVLGVPGHVYRRSMGELARWIGRLLCFNPSAAFVHELRLRFLLAFARQRILQRGL